MDTKECDTCRCLKSLEDFYVYRTGTSYSQCKVCHKARTKQWHIDNPYARREANWKRHGIDCNMEKFEQMLAEQDSVCKICQKPCGSGNHLAVDHNHETGEVRGLLCLSCNQAVGKFENGTIPFHRFVQYLGSERNQL